MLEQIPTEEWRDFLENYSRRHRGWTASFEVSGANEPFRTSIRKKRFNGARIEEYDGDDVVLLRFGEQPEVTRAIVAPSSLLAERAPDGDDIGVWFGTADNSVFRLLFRVPAHVDRIETFEPELVSK